MAEHHLSSTDTEDPEDLVAYHGLAPGWYTDPADPTTVRFWDGVTLGQERHPAVFDPTDSDDSAVLQPDDSAAVEAVDSAAVEADDAAAVEADDAAAVEAADATTTGPASDDYEGTCVKCGQSGRYYDNPDWCEELRDGDGTLVLMGSKYSDDMTCLECETELDSHHTERWIEVWAQKPRALATRGKSLSTSMQSSSAGA